MPTTDIDSRRRSSSASHNTGLIAEISARRERAREFLRSRVMNESSFARLARPDKVFRCTTLALRCGYRCPASCAHKTEVSQRNGISIKPQDYVIVKLNPAIQQQRHSDRARYNPRLNYASDFFFLMRRQPPRSTLFPDTTLFQLPLP